ncbi:DUF455 domain-containing protein [Campylobacter sp. MIT 99-7217]|uniref:ferritin-like domain-containing protein n=1 Tax=Campylobacter sp. MIT 99-7217 TaxID=535091 RepID=UPI00115AB431|nr:ferritin-like domain-containing protein [Campylobacter sp. MIT 99-7217]TQR33783.1 DUF455 domain-containing protein [Campylobacter sp. MIT 99-7217]
MKKEFFENLEKILYAKNLDDKFRDFDDFYENFKTQSFVFNHEQEAIFKENFYPSKKILSPLKIRRIKNANSNESLAKMIHAIAHIEFSAINLALDASYRFKNLPQKFYEDWLEVADEEIKHFKLLQRALRELGFKYGDFAVHDNLENALKSTKNSLAFRMGVVHRGLEAKGLDANPFVLSKLQNTNHHIKSLLEEILSTILNDEIKHVKKGDFWWSFAKKDEDDFLHLCKKFIQFKLAGKVLNKEARLKAGFSEKELEELENFYSRDKTKI